MLRMQHYYYLFTLLGVITLFGCGSDMDCENLSEAAFRSVEIYDLGLGPDGPVPGHWTIYFEDGHYTWNYTDVVNTGNFICSDGEILRVTKTGLESTGTFDSTTGILVWQGREYQVIDSIEQFKYRQ
ncbi:MAG: hypothetical protein HJJLKODD_00609 [Phycisphaerae bacterium]|nr:hypothetical protein [Phycisphaerae bacterium]